MKHENHLQVLQINIKTELLKNTKLVGLGLRSWEYLIKFISQLA
jgi:hypothetical protein